MSLTAFLLVIFAALLHASWNAIVKRGSDSLLSTILVTGFAALLSALLLPWMPPLDPRSLPWLAISVVLQVLYYILVARAYRHADMGLAYPLMRGSAPVLVAVAGSLLLGEHLATPAWAGILLVSLGILSMTIGNRWHHVGLPLLNAAVIATYTLVDAHGTRLSGSAATYTLWLFLLSGLPLPLWALARRRQALLDYLPTHWRGGVLGGAGTTLSYGLALWAMTQAPVAMVSALRETSIVFALLISALVLREPLQRRRVLAAIAIILGAASLRLA